MKTRHTLPALAFSVLLGMGITPLFDAVAPVPSACAAVQTAAEWYQRGSEAQDAEQYEEAVQDYTEAIRLDPTYADAYNNRGVVYCVLQEYERALGDCTEAICLDPQYAGAYYNRDTHAWKRMEKPSRILTRRFVWSRPARKRMQVVDIAIFALAGMQTLCRMRSGQTSSPREVRILSLNSCGRRGFNEAEKRAAA